MHEICLCSCDAPKLTVRLRELESVKLSAKAQEMQFSVYSLREPGRDSGPGSKSNNQTHLTSPFGFWLLAFGCSLASCLGLACQLHWNTL